MNKTALYHRRLSVGIVNFKLHDKSSVPADVAEF